MTRKPGEVILDSVLFSLFIRRLSGTDPVYDTEIIKSFSEASGIPARKILATIRTHCRPGNLTLH
jgi:hypothetical protein